MQLKYNSLDNITFDVEIPTVMSHLVVVKFNNKEDYLSNVTGFTIGHYETVYEQIAPPMPEETIVETPQEEEKGKEVTEEEVLFENTEFVDIGAEDPGINENPEPVEVPEPVAREIWVVEQDYSAFTTINNEIPQDSVIWYSDDGSIYIPPSAEEEAIRERSIEIMDLESELEGLEIELASSDYIITKCYEKALIGEPTPGYDLPTIAASRQELRDRINYNRNRIRELKILNGEEVED